PAEVGRLRDVRPRRHRRLGSRPARRRVGSPRESRRARPPRACARADQGLACARGHRAVIDLDGGALSLEAVEAVARRGEEVRLSPAAARTLGASRAFVDRLAAGVEPIYGITTGVGKLKDVVIPPGERAELQRNLVLSHAGGMGAPLPDVEVRAIMLLLAASLSRGASAVRPARVEPVLASLNRRVHPSLPDHGSLAAPWGANAAFDARIHALRPHPGQLATAANLRKLTAESAIIASHLDCTRVQDAYSLRCMPQVHGSAREAVAFARSIVERELGA